MPGRPKENPYFYRAIGLLGLQARKSQHRTDGLSNHPLRCPNDPTIVAAETVERQAARAKEASLPRVLDDHVNMPSVGPARAGCGDR